MQKLNCSPGRYTALDGWRGICALLVAAYHLETTSHLQQLGLVRHAYLFVDFFFVLSGFVLTYAYFDRLTSARAAVSMMWRRIGRLWPLHLALLAAFVALELAVPLIAWAAGLQRGAAVAFDPAAGMSLSALLPNALLLHGLGFNDRLTWNQPSWSISAELWAYVGFAVLATLLRRWSLAVAVAMIGVALLVVVVFSDRYMEVDYDFGLFRCVAGFLVGHLVFRFCRAFPTGLPAATAVEIAAVVMVVAFVTFAARTPAELAAPFVFGAVVWVFTHEAGIVTVAMRSAAAQWLGALSYSVYMVHALLIALINHAVTAGEQVLAVQLSHPVTIGGEGARMLDFGSALVMDGVVAVYLLAVLGLATLTWRFIEKPAQAWWNGPAEALVLRWRPASGNAAPAVVS